MPKSVNKEFIEDIAIELGILPSFVEKDFYAVQLLKELSKIHYESAALIFTGGTCLSKAYELIKRFSEDIDFRIQTNIPFSRKDRRLFRQAIIDKLKQVQYIEVLEETLEKQNESKFFSFYISYPQHFEPTESLRNNLKLEFSFEDVLLPTQICKIQSIISKYTDGADKLELNCVSPVEIGANKLSALMWRVDIKDRTKQKGNIANDATIIRHLHDLAALESLILSSDFIKSIQLSFNTDKGRGGSNKDITLAAFTEKTLTKLKTDKIYSKEYKNFVDALSYANEVETIDFKTAMLSFERIVDFILQNQG